MGGHSYFQHDKGLMAILADDPTWPNPANIFIIPDDSGFILIDAGCGGEAGPAYLLEGLEHFGLSLPDLHTVVLSHSHPDHMGALSWIMEEANPRVMIHHRDLAGALNEQHLVDTFDIPLAKRRAAESPEEDKHQDFDLMEFFNAFGCSMGTVAEAEVFYEGDTLDLGAYKFEIYNTPGHSPGHVSLFDREKGLLLAGDMVGGSPAWYTPTSGGTIGYLNSLDTLKTLESNLILPSHGPVLDDPEAAILKIEKRLLDREAFVLEALAEGPKTFWELNAVLLRSPYLFFFPGCGITESHLIKLLAEERINEVEGGYSLV